MATSWTLGISYVSIAYAIYQTKNQFYRQPKVIIIYTYTYKYYAYTC